MTVFQLIRSDYNKYKKYGSGFFAIVFLTQGFWAIFQYRVARYLFTTVSIQPFRFIIKCWILIWRKHLEILTGISIPATAQIGHSFYIGHYGAIIFNDDVILGNNCNVAQGVTLGISGWEERRGVPTIGNNVFIGPNATIVGKITIGDDVLIGANSFVNMDVAANCTMLGVPAQVISNKGSKAYI
jgi:serine O-acetyltransferase